MKQGRKAEFSRLRRYCVTMVQPTEPWQGLNLAFSSRADRYWPTCRRILLETQVRSILMVVAHVFCHESLQMPFVEDDHVFEQISSATPNPTLGDTVLPRTAKGSACWVASHFLHRRHHIATKFRVVIEQQELCAGTYGHASRNCCTIQGAFGFRVTLKYRIFRRS